MNLLRLQIVWALAMLRSVVSITEGYRSAPWNSCALIWYSSSFLPWVTIVARMQGSLNYKPFTDIYGLIVIVCAHLAFLVLVCHEVLLIDLCFWRRCTMVSMLGCVPYVNSSGIVGTHTFGCFQASIVVVPKFNFTDFLQSLTKHRLTHL